MMARGGTRHYDWTPEEDEILRKYADGEASVPAIKQAFYEETGDERSITTIRKRMHFLGLPLRGRGAKKLEISQNMKDFVAIGMLQGAKITTITDRFNERFDTDWAYSKIYRIALETRTDKERPLTKSIFTEEWLRLQKQLAPSGAVRRKHWLWRWRRMDENRTSSSCVFRGEKEPIPDLFNEAQFKDEWRKMQALFGITN